MEVKTMRGISYTIDTKYLMCGTFMTRNRKSLFFPDNEFIRKIIKIAESLNGKLVNSNKEGYHRIEMENNFGLKLVFRLSRYSRTDYHKRIIDNIVKCLDEGLDSKSAIIIGHTSIFAEKIVGDMYNHYYDLMIPDRMYKPVNIENWNNKLKNGKIGYVNYSFDMHVLYSLDKHPKFKKACLDKDFKLANKILNNNND